MSKTAATFGKVVRLRPPYHLADSQCWTHRTNSCRQFNCPLCHHSSGINANGYGDYATYTPSDGMFHILFDSGGWYHRPWGGSGNPP